jgi:argininosuccinate lyase
MLSGMKKPWSGRFEGRTSKTVEDFTESVSFDWRLWPYDIEGSIAHARMLGHTGIIKKAEAARIVKGLKAVAIDIERGRLRFNPALEDIHMNIEAALARKVGPVAGKLHTARSRNDQVALDLRLYLRAETKQVILHIESLQAALVEQAERNFHVIMPGYTHLQRAQPVLLSHHLLAYAEMLERDKERLGDGLKRIEVLPLGSAALAGTSLPIDRRFVAKALGFRALSQNSMDAVSDRDFVVEFLSAASIVMVHLSRLSEDLVLWASEEFSFVALPDEYATGSSIMPQKKNPDIPELVRGKAGRVFGSLVAILTTLKGLPLAYNRDLQEDKPLLFESVDTVNSSLAILSEMIGALRFNSARMGEAAAGGFSTATDVAEYLVERGMPFRKAHEVAGKIVRHCEKAGMRLEELSVSEFRRFSGLFGKDIKSRLGVEKSVLSRAAEGGTSPRQVRRQIRRLKRILSI